ncbi:MAG: hypothetical protein IT455_00740 [Planctomycetes bacterium]|nr:hypothetical protein [Planctomycetota bacterium]
MANLLAAVVLSFACATLLPAQEPGPAAKNGEGALARALLGSWRLDAELSRRLGADGRAARVEFRSDAAVVARLPAATVARLQQQQMPVLQQGTMLVDGSEHTFVLTVQQGDTMVLGFRADAGAPLAEVGAFPVTLARGKDAGRDLLLLGVGEPGAAMAAYTREVAAKRGLTPQATVTHMMQLLEAGKAREFVETYAAPDDLARLIEGGRTLDDLAARFTGERLQTLLAVLDSVSKAEPEWNQTRDEVKWPNTTGDGPKEVKLKLVDGRWYLKDR